MCWLQSTYGEEFCSSPMLITLILFAQALIDQRFLSAALQFLTVKRLREEGYLCGHLTLSSGLRNSRGTKLES